MGRIEGTGRFVRKADRGPFDQRSPDRHPLFLATRQFGRKTIQLVAKFELLEHLFGTMACLVRRLPFAPTQDQFELLSGRQCGKQMTGLKDKTKMSLAKRLPLVFLQVP